eukprot:scaffold6802_cov64-Phaeocystis_antarctica.AAC.4
MTTIAAQSCRQHISLMSAMTVSDSSESRPDVISSKTSSCGLVTSAHASASRLRSPPDRPRTLTPPGSIPPIGRCTTSPRSPTSASTLWMREPRTTAPPRSRPSTMLAEKATAS